MNSYDVERVTPTSTLHTLDQVDDVTATPIPPDLGAVYDVINNDVSSVHATWDVYRHLFGSEEDVIDLMNEFCPFAARMVQDALLDSVLLQITRLMDPAQSPNGKKNLTLERLIGELENPPDEFVAQLREQLAAIHSAIEAFRDHRNKRIAHTDLEHALADNVNLAAFSRESIETALKAMREFMNTINTKYRFGPTSYETTLVIGGGDALVRVFRMASRLAEFQNSAWEPGTSAEDILKRLRFDIL